jgi:hypothetical protein
MKAKFILFTLLFSLAFQLVAQDGFEEQKKSYFKFGPKVGLDLNANLNDLPSGNEFAEELKGNYQFGGFMQFGKRLYLQPEFMYAVINTTDDQNEPVSYEFFKIPVHIGLKFFDIGLLSLHLSGGAIYTHNVGEAFSFDKEKINYQIGAGIDVFDFITTDLRYTLKKGVSLADQINDFTANGGVINITVGLKL